jgi:hypothetical protein
MATSSYLALPARSGTTGAAFRSIVTSSRAVSACTRYQRSEWFRHPRCEQHVNTACSVQPPTAVCAAANRQFETEVRVMPSSANDCPLARQESLLQGFI